MSPFVPTDMPSKSKDDNETSTSISGSHSESEVDLCKVNTVLLQTARAQVSSVDEKKSENLRILFDCASQLSYITPAARKLLNLKTITKKTVNIKSFGERKDKKEVDVVKFAVKSKDGGMNIYVNALVSDTCLPIDSKKIRFAKSRYKHLKNLDLADENPSNLPLNIDILIGSDFYWNFFNSTFVKGDGQGPVAMSSKLGYVLSGPVNALGSENYSTHINTMF